MKERDDKVQFRRDLSTDEWVCQTCYRRESVANGTCNHRCSAPSAIAPVTVEREKTHGDYARSALLCQSMKGFFRSSMYPRTLAAPHQEAAEMILFKLSRTACGNPNHADHWRDIAGYATLVADRVRGG